jgi:hypothetical protein
MGEKKPFRRLVEWLKGSQRLPKGGPEFKPQYEHKKKCFLEYMETTLAVLHISTLMLPRCLAAAK